MLLGWSDDTLSSPGGHFRFLEVGELHGESFSLGSSPNTSRWLWDSNLHASHDKMGLPHMKRQIWLAVPCGILNSSPSNSCCSAGTLSCIGMTDIDCRGLHSHIWNKNSRTLSCWTHLLQAPQSSLGISEAATHSLHSSRSRIHHLQPMSLHRWHVHSTVAPRVRAQSNDSA